MPELSARFPPGLVLGGLLSAGERSLSSWGNIYHFSLPASAGGFIVRPLGDSYNRLGRAEILLYNWQKMSTASSFFRKLRAIFPWERFAVVVILFLGFVLRLRQYFTGRSLWLDEAMLALNIVNRDLAGLFRPLDYDQGSPIGFLLVEKFFYLLFGDHEFILRFFPFVAGIAALGLFYFLLQRTTSRFGLLTGLALFAFSPELIYYSSEVKQYSLDVAVAIGLLLLADPLLDGRIEKRGFFYLGLAGIFGLWFSHPALFVSTGIGIGLLIRSIVQRRRSQIGLVLKLGGIWLVNLGLLYFVSLRGLSQNQFLVDYWQENFVPIPPWSDWSWFKAVFEDIVQIQVGVQISSWLALIILILGLVFLSSKNKAFGGVLSFIFIFALIASALRLYPLGGRLSLFLVPLVILLISLSIDTLEHRFPTQFKWSTFVALFVGAYLLYSPISESFNNYSNPKYFEHIRPSMQVLAEHWRQGDSLFVSNGALPAFRFYADRYGLDNVSYQTSQASDYSEPEKILRHLEVLDGKSRVWVLITHVYETEDFNEKDFLLSSLDAMGEHKREFRSPGTSVYLNLYDLSH